MAHASNFYFDLAYDKDPKEPGNYWAGFVGTRQPYEFAPFNLYTVARTDLMGNKIDPAAFKDSVRLTETGKQHILGLQGELRSEDSKGQEVMEYQIFPKLLSLAERAWASEPAWEPISPTSERDAELAAGWNEFANRLGQRELSRLSYLYGGVNYRIPPPGAVVENGILKANVAFPGLIIRYTTDGGEPNVHSNLYTGPVPVHATTNLEVFATGARHSRISVVTPPDTTRK
jgi:hexosaminidase